MEDSVSIFIANSFVRKSLVYENNHLSNGPGNNVLCGSHAEFYIVPLLSCINDTDALICQDGAIAFSGYNVVLPDDVRCFGEKIDCLRLLPCKNYPGFVQVRLFGHMIYNWNIKRFEFLKAKVQRFVTGHVVRYHLTEKMDTFAERLDATLTGPAVKIAFGQGIYDEVYCYSCPKWPEEAKEWPTRRRSGEWPPGAIILEVVRSGCHVVCAQHRDCRDDYYQFRFSFSVAEVILLRSWTPTQQLLYHMLRFFAKRELIEEDCPIEKKVLCTYHLKTLMLWTCEQESAEWWKSSSVIAICCKLLRKLLEWIERRNCSNYFIPEANLFNQNIDQVVTNSITDKLKVFCDAANLSQWFVSNYLLQCYMNLTRGQESHDLEEFEINRLYRMALRYKRLKQLKIFDDRFTAISCAYMKGFWEFSEIEICNEIKAYAHKKGSISLRRNTLLKFEVMCIHLDSVLFMLHAASALTCKQVLNCNDFVSDSLSVVPMGIAASLDWRRYHNFPKTYRERLQMSHTCFVIAQEHMGKLRTPGKDPEFQLMSRLSMHYLTESYNTKEVSTCSIQSATVVYMAAICFATSQFQAAFDLCSTIFQNTKPVVTSQMPRPQEEPLNAGCLIFIDDVSNCVGFILLFQIIISKLRADNRQFELSLRLTPQVFAKYIMIQSAERMSKQLRMNWDEIPTVYLIDSLFTKAMKRKLSNIARCSSRMWVFRRNDQVEEVLNRVTGFDLSEDISIRLLMECSLESIASLYQQIYHYYGVQCYTVVSCYRALYLFKCCQYDNVLRLCDQILDDPEMGDYITKLSRPHMIVPKTHTNCLAFPNVLALRPFSVYFDEDLQCLIGLQALCHVSFPDLATPAVKRNTFDLQVPLKKYSRPRSKTDRVFNTLIHCKSVMFQYFLGRHFLARYLKLRCFLLCDKKSISEIFEAFGELKPELPFEHVVYQFLLRKLQRNFND